MNESHASSINSETALVGYIYHYTAGHLLYGPSYERLLPSHVEKFSGFSINANCIRHSFGRSVTSRFTK